MKMDNVGLKIRLLGTSSSMIINTFFFLMQIEVARNNFNDQSHILEEQGTTSWSIM